MANTIIGNTAALLAGILAPGATVTYESDGTITAQARYQYSQNATVSLNGAAHPDDSRATCVSFTLEYDEVFLYANAVYRGVWSGSSTKVDVQASLQANPIETHPNFVSTLGGTPGSPLNGAVFDANGTFLGWPAGASLNLGGVRYYLAASNTYRFTNCTSSGATMAGVISAIGSVASSISAGGLTVTGTDAFMLQNVTADYQATGAGNVVYTYTQVWVSTQPPGWNTAIYPP